MRHYADKECQGCGTIFAPTGPRSLKCDGCRKQEAPVNPPESTLEAPNSPDGYPSKGTRRKLCRSRFTDSTDVTLRCERERHDEGEHKSGVWCWTDPESDNPKVAA